MKQYIKQIVIAIVAVGVIMGASIAPLFSHTARAAGQAAFNNDPQDYATVRVSNYTQNPGSTSSWSSNVTANNGDLVSFSIYYHNTSQTTANNTKVSLSVPIQISGSTFSVSGKVWADNASAVNGSASVNLQGTAGQQWTATLDSAYWYPNQTQSSPQSINTSMIASGASIGNIAPGWSTQGSVVVRYKVTASGGGGGGNAPIVQTNQATNVTTSAATLQGNVDPQGSTTTYWFEYGQTASFGYTTSQVNAGSSANSASQPISNLLPNTTYYFRVDAQNQYGTTHGSTLSFTTQNIVTGNAPLVTTTGSTNVAQSSATLNGQVNPNGATTNYWFEYGTTQSFGNTTSMQSAGAGSSYLNVTVPISGLIQNTTYYFRVDAQNQYGTTNGSILSFYTQAGYSNMPSVTTLQASSISGYSAQLNGYVDPQGSATTYWFEYGTNQSLGMQTQSQSTSGAANISSYVSGLQQNATYYFRVDAQNQYGTVYGSILSFSTYQGGNYGSQPIANTSSATNITNNSSQLNGTINSNNTYTSYWFEYGTTQSLGNTTVSQSAGSGSGSYSVSAQIYNLSPNTTYYFRVDAQNQYGTAYGGILSFYTSSGSGCYGSGCNNNTVAPYVQTYNASGITQTTATLYGSVNPNGTTATGWFEYGTDPNNLVNRTNTISIYSYTTATNMQMSISNLQAGTTYYFRAAASNYLGTSYGSTLSFTAFGQTTNGQVPVATTKAATYISQNSALLNGTVNPNGTAATNAWFEYGTSPSLGSRTISQPVGYGTQDAVVSAAATGLMPGTTYYYRIVAQNTYGSTYGFILGFTTPGTTIVPNNGGTNTIIVNTTSFGGGQSCVLIVPTISNDKLNAGDPFTYTFTYRNGCTYNLSNAYAKIILPTEVTYISTNYPLFQKDSNGITYNLGTLVPGAQGAISIQGTVNTAAIQGDILIFSSVLNYSDAKLHPQSISSYLTAQILSGKNLSASIFDAFRSLFGSWWFSLLLLLIIIFLILWFAFSKKRNTPVEDDVDVLKA